MTAVQLVATLRARGVELVPAGNRLRFRPGEAVTSEEREMLAAVKGEVLAMLAPLALDQVAVRMVLGPRPEPPAVHALEGEVRAAIAQYQIEAMTGVIGARLLLIRGRPLADYLDLETVAQLLRSWPSQGLMSTEA
jgi:hypothetical protein